MIEHDKVYNMDCLDIFKEIPSESIDLVITDPPYRLQAGGVTVIERGNECKGILNKRRSGVVVQGNDNDFYLCGRSSKKWVKKNGSMPSAVKSGKMFENNDIEFAEWLPEVYRVLKKGTHCYIMINSRNIKELQTEAEKVGFAFQNLLVWDKSNMSGTPNKYYMQKCEFILMLSKRPARNINDMGTSNLLKCPNIIGKGEDYHPTAKPVSLMEVLIRNSSNKGDIVLDPFCGGGSTLVAARNLARHYIGFEIDEQYYNMTFRNLSLPQQKSLFD